MTSRERVRAALAHRQPDRVPVDFGATATSGMHVSCVAALRTHHGLAPRPVKVTEPYQMLGELDTELQAVLGIDTEAVPAPQTLFGFPSGDWKPWRTPWGQDVLVAGGFETAPAPGGGTWIYPQGDRRTPPSGLMPAGGFFFDTLVRQPPIDEARLDPADNLEEFGPLTEADLEHYRRRVAAAAATGRAVVATLPGLALGDIALVPAPFLKRPRGIRDIAEWYMATAARRDYVRRVFERQTEIALANLPRLHAVLGDRVDAVFVCGTDFGTQTSAFCSLDTFRDLYLPFYRQINGWIHAHTPWKTLKHSCGAVAPFIPEFIAAGFDILNPVQCSAAGMDAAELKRRFGADIVFWGGGIDTQRVLPFGTPAEVREQVRRRCDVFNRGGGFVFNAVHNVQAGTPVANLAALFAALRECR